VDKCIFLLTGDLHGRLSQESEERLTALRQEANTLLLDAGDAVAAGNLQGGKKRDTILARMSRIGYDAMAMGNRESHPFRKLLESKTAPARFPILAANMMAKRQPLPSKVKSHILRRLSNGINVAVIGLAPQMTTPDSWWSRVTDYVFDAPEKTVEGLVKKLRKESDLIVLLSHCGIEMDRRLAKIEAVDLVLGGHSHLELFEQGDGAPILHSGHFGRKLGRAEVDLECGKIIKIGAELIPLNEPSKR
jgi:5'-nucleotidase